MEKYRNINWNKEIAIQREKNNEDSKKALRDRYEVEYSWQPVKTNDNPILKIIFGATLGLMLVGFIFFESGLMFTNGVINSVDSHLKNEAQTAQMKIKQEKTALDVELERLKLERAEVELKRKQIEENNKLAYTRKLEEQRIIEENNRLAYTRSQEEKRIKESKWKAFYRKPDNCSPPPTHQVRVECGNFYIREKAKFDDLYSKGKI